MLQIRSNVAITRSVLLRWQGQYYCDGKVSTTAIAKSVLLRWQSQYYCHKHKISLRAERKKVTAWLSLPKPIGYIQKIIAHGTFVETLVGGATLQASQMFDIRAKFDIIKIGTSDRRRYARPSTVPCHLERGMLTMDMSGQHVDVCRFGITPHQADAGDVGAIIPDETIHLHGCEGRADVLPQILAVASRTAAGTSGDVDGERHFIGYLLEYDSCIDVFQHNGTILVINDSYILSAVA